jgi:general secretion pathway protein J
MIRRANVSAPWAAMRRTLRPPVAEVRFRTILPHVKIATSRTLRAFTLIELLIALAILALTAVLGYRALDSLTGSETRLAAEGERWRMLDGFFARLEADMRAAVPREARLGDATESAWLGGDDALGNAELRFSRAASEFGLDAGGAGQRIGYRLRNGNVEVLYWPRFDRRADTVPLAYGLVGGVARFRIQYLDARGAWRDRWPALGESPLPRAVRVELALDGGETIARALVLR